ncbi:hypothetical protein ABZ690_11270, partial [Streptomyces sp. NPDC006967]|uniref:hypothetical protein n=1 Tax=Streptomyces sp. NPDC006967 TaxID=3156906 RepID=UPI00340E651E
RIGLKARLTAAAETKTLGLGDVRSVVTGVVKRARCMLGTPRNLGPDGCVHNLGSQPSPFPPAAGATSP